MKRKTSKASQNTTVSDAKLSSTFRDAFALMDQQKAAGVPFGERVKGLEGVLRDSLPNVREWKYLCKQCSDYGLVMHSCVGDSTCGRPNPHLPHDYGTPCLCAAGRRFRPVPPPEPPQPRNFAEAGRAEVQEQPAPVGRWKKRG